VLGLVRADGRNKSFVEGMAIGGETLQRFTGVRWDGLRHPIQLPEH
jgi:hypothetical protein